MDLSLSKKPVNTTSTPSSATKAQAYTASEIQSGFFVVASIALLLFLLFLTGQSNLFHKMKPIELRFNYISGLKKNAPVHFAGHEVGKVTNIQFVGAEEGKIAVMLAIREEIPLKADSEAFINILGFMGETYIELSTGTTAAGELSQGTFIRGTDPVPMMQIVKKGTELLDEFEKITGSLKGMVGDLDGILSDNKEDVDQIFNNLNASSANLKEMTHDLKLHPWKLLKKDKKAKKFLFF